VAVRLGQVPLVFLSFSLGTPARTTEPFVCEKAFRGKARNGEQVSSSMTLASRVKGFDPPKALI
jgi:hypothetical protein